MAINILMPALSPTMEMGNLIKWHVKEGDKVFPGDLIAEIETDKATMEFEAVDEGIISKIKVPEGTQDVSVNEVIAEILIDDDSNNRVEEEIVHTDIGKDRNIKSSKKSVTKGSATSSNNKVEATQQIKEQRTKISPLAKKLAINNNLDPTNITGSGPYGRIVKADILSFLDENQTQKIAKDYSSQKIQDPEVRALDETKPKLPDTIERIYKNRNYQTVELTGIRKSIANKLTESKQTIPHFYLRRTINVDQLLRIRTELNEELKKQGDKISINDFIIKACAKALKENPYCNSVWAVNKILRLNNVDIAVAVAIDDGLMTPILYDADLKTLKEISLEMKVLAEKARLKKLLPEEYTGGSFSISNLGMMGVENFDAVINPPQASILAVGTTLKQNIIDDGGKISTIQTISVTLSVDHRVIDGATGAVFLRSIAKYLSNPIKLLL